MACVRLRDCPFYNDKLDLEHRIEKFFKKIYCKGDYHLCARYKVICEAGEAFVPRNLYPNMVDIAQKIIEGINKR